MKRIASIFLVLSLFLALGIVAISAPGARAAELSGGGYLRTTYSIDTYYESVWGNILQSTLDVDPATGRAWHYDENLKIGLSRSLPSGLGVEFAFWGRHTTDGLFQRTPGESWMVDEMRLRLTGEAFDIGLGDLSAFYSNYTFNNAFFGATTTLRPTPWLSVSVLGGTNRDARRDTYRRAFGGARIEVRPSASALVAASWVHTEITELYDTSTVTDYANDVWSLSSRISFLDKRLVFSGELAASSYVADRRLPGAGEQWGTAAWCALSFTPLRNELSLVVAYERVDPKFIGVMGTHSADRETLSAGLRYTPSEMLTATAYFRWFHDRVTDASPAAYRTDTMDPGVTVTIMPFFYDPDSAFKNLAIDFTAFYFREQSRDAPRSVADERLIARLSVGDSRDAFRWAVISSVERYDDRTAADLDTTAGTLGAQFGYRADADRYTLSADLLAEFRVEAVRDLVRGRLYDTAVRLSAGTAASFSFFPDYPTRCSVRYEGILRNRESGDDTREHSFHLTIEQVLMRRAGLTGTLGLDGSFADVRSSNPDLSFTEAVFGIYMSLEY
ncbi:MAG: hypothetical protein JW765_03415 [Deltaproteobacteria bacterium]|nr:hypothetical protein [Candidatus Zymogenaceae bacterium]